MNKIINANNLEYLKTMEDNSIDAVVTDPPYGIAFMNKKWDYNVPTVEFWNEVYRVLKPGGHILSFGGTRTFHRLTVNIEDAGFNIRDTIVWHYGQGFPKSHNISKNLDKKDKSDEAKQWDGWGTALKPATELICLAQKPISEKTIIDNILKWNVGGINIDGTRISLLNNETKTKGILDLSGIHGGNLHAGSTTKAIDVWKSTEGRFPANLILSHHPECIETDEIITLNEGKKKEKIIYTKSYKKDNHPYHNWNKNPKTILGEEKIKKYICHDDCPLKIMDEQSGTTPILKKQPKRNIKNLKTEQSGFNKNASEYKIQYNYGDTGGASRFFYCPKPSPKEKQEGNTHPTVKPIKLMEYLIKMITPANGIVLDPFGGSGTTALAAKNLNLNYILIEMDKDYCDIINNRIKNLNND